MLGVWEKIITHVFGVHAAQALCAPPPRMCFCMLGMHIKLIPCMVSGVHAAQALRAPIPRTCFCMLNIHVT